jgi:hypothetical protein
MVVVAFDSSMWIIMIPLMGVSCIVDSMVGKMGLVSEQNVMNHMAVRINPAAEFQPANPWWQVQDAECTGYGMDTILLCVTFTRTSCAKH